MNKEQNMMSILHPKAWETVSLNLLTKMIAEFMYEEIINPQQLESNGTNSTYQLRLDHGVSYTFTAKERLFDSYRVYDETIERHESGVTKKAINPILFLQDIQNHIGMSSFTTAHLIREYNQTLIADAHLLANKQHQQSKDITQLDYSLLEGEMEGHPWITYNKGRIGFGYDDYLSYAPEQKQPIQLFWIAVHKEKADFHAVEGIVHDDLIYQELGEQTIDFHKQLLETKVNPDHYYFMPVHEWQWNNYIIPFFADNIAKRLIIFLGTGEDQYLPQQSIRTFVNIDQKQRHHVKLPISILNTLVYRGLPGERTVLAPTITTFIKNIWNNDPYLKDECRLILPGEIASLNYDHPDYAKMKGVPYQFQELLGCIWRESIYSYVDEDEQAITLASLLYIDGNGKPFISSLVETSGLALEDWLDQLFTVILSPLLHYLYHYGVVFSPHGQNTILILKKSTPHRLAIKDFVDDVNISRHSIPELKHLPAKLRKVLRSEDPEGLCQFIFTGLFICHMRYLSDLLETYHNFPESYFWKKVRSSILQYQSLFPEKKERYELFDLLKPTFTKLCLNRNRMLNDGYETADDRPHASEYSLVHNALSIS